MEQYIARSPLSILSNIPTNKLPLDDKATALNGVLHETLLMFINENLKCERIYTTINDKRPLSIFESGLITFDKLNHHLQRR